MVDVINKRSSKDVELMKLMRYMVLTAMQYNIKFTAMHVPGNDNIQEAVSIRKTVLPGMAIPMLKIRRPNGRLIFNMEIAIRR